MVAAGAAGESRSRGVEGPRRTARPRPEKSGGEPRDRPVAELLKELSNQSSTLLRKELEQQLTRLDFIECEGRNHLQTVEQSAKAGSSWGVG